MGYNAGCDDSLGVVTNIGADYRDYDPSRDGSFMRDRINVEIEKLKQNEINSEIETALKLCQEAWAQAPGATHAWCCHHEEFFEQLTEPAANRIDYILSHKPKPEQVVRLNNFRPVRNQVEFDKLSEDYQAKRKLLDEDYWAKLKPLDEDYWAKVKLLQQPLMVLYRREVPLGTWNGSSIFEKK